MRGDMNRDYSAGKFILTGAATAPLGVAERGVKKRLALLQG